MSNIEELKRLAAQDDPQAQFELAVHYLQNQNSEGLDWLQKAAENGHLQAKEAMGKIEMPQQSDDEIKVLNMLKEKSKQGDAEAQFSLGIAYEFGTYGVEDIKEAAKWYKEAACQKHAKAIFSFYII